MGPGERGVPGLSCPGAWCAMLCLQTTGQSPITSLKVPDPHGPLAIVRAGKWYWRPRWAAPHWPPLRHPRCHPQPCALHLASQPSIHLLRTIGQYPTWRCRGSSSVGALLGRTGEVVLEASRAELVLQIDNQQSAAHSMVRGGRRTRRRTRAGQTAHALPFLGVFDYIDNLHW